MLETPKKNTVIKNFMNNSTYRENQLSYEET